MTASPKRDRSRYFREYRQARKERGFHNVNVFLYADSWATIQDLCAAQNSSVADVIDQLLIEHLVANVDRNFVP